MWRGRLSSGRRSERNLDIYKREKQKSEAFITTPGDSKKLIESSNERLNKIETILIPAQEELINKLKAEESIWKDKNINPKIANYSKSESAIKEKEESIAKELDELALSIGINEKDKKDLLLKKLKEYENSRSLWKADIAEGKGNV